MKNYLSRLRPALRDYLLNHLIMHIPFYGPRHYYLRRVCGIKIGRHSSVHMDCFITGNSIEIGDNTVINRQCYLDGRFPLRIGNNINISHQVLIHTLTHDPQAPDFRGVAKPVAIEDDAWIGTRAIILPGVRIGRGVVVGAGAVVTKDVSDYGIVAGCPAREIGKRNTNLTYKTSYFPFFDTDIQ
jgi:acetyltransferase-like isoleucine patch superfamily enzyme